MNFKIRKKVIIIGIILIVAVTMLLVVLFKNDDEEPINNELQETIVNVQEEKINLIQYTNGELSMKIPEGWMVENVTGNKYAIHIYNPNNTTYQMFFITSAGGFLKSIEAKQYYQIYATVSNNELQKLPILDPQTPENLFKNWNTLVGFMKTNINGFTNFNFPLFMNFNVKEHFALTTKIQENLKNKVSQAILRASFTSADASTKGDGMFSVSIVDVKENDINSPVATYNVMGVSTPKGELIRWMDVFVECLSSLKFNNNYLKNNDEQLFDVNDEIKTIVSGYKTAWETRQINEDIQEQKSIDANLNLERVYNVNNGKVYSANKGWFSKYIGEDYKLITDDMYLKPLDGRVE
ncbi:MAG: hypothetical protein IKV94_03855 [Clostridia bacterium]|nr:hypothetical protein [Clostridia bacterium]